MKVGKQKAFGFRGKTAFGTKAFRDVCHSSLLTRVCLCVCVCWQGSSLWFDFGFESRFRLVNTVLYEKKVFYVG